MNPALPQFVRQDDKPLFPTVLYNRPVTRQGAGRLLVPGGHTGDLSLPTVIHQLAMASGVGECDVVLPDPLAKLASGAPGTHFAAATPAGSLGPEALGRILELAETADAVALGASLSANSGTAMLIERLATELPQLGRPLIAFADALELLRHHTSLITNNPDALIIATMPEVFKLCGALGIPINIRPQSGLIGKLEIVRDLRAASRCQYAVYGSEIIIAADHELIVTPINYRLSLMPALFCAVLSTFWLQNRDRRAGLATGAWLIRQLEAEFGPTNQPSTSRLATALDQLLRHDEF